jgi:CubicO group peptidase (beta-lactamase class C family)
VSRVGSLVLALVVGAATALGQAPPASPTPVSKPPSPERLARGIEDYLRPLADAGELSGTLLVARGDGVVFEKSFGKASYELNVPNTSTTRFCVASITKPMTGIIATRLLLDKKLTREDNLAKWFPDFPKGQQITVEHLMRHRSGIPHRVTSEEEETVPRTASEMVQMAARRPLAFEPGSQDAYSSAGYSVLAAVLERSSGRTYSQLLEEIVLRPVGATRTSHPDSRQILPERAQSYFRGRNGPIHARLRDLSFLVGAGSVYSTPRDLFAISRGLVKGTYGEGAQTVLIRENGLRWNGITNGFRAFLDYHRDQDLTVIWTGNLFTGAADLIRQNVPSLNRGEVVPAATVPQVVPAALSPALRARVEGTYRLGPGSEQELRFQEPLLAALGDWFLVPTGGDTFFSPQDYARVKVISGGDGSVEALQWGEPGKGPRFERVRP